MFGCYRKAEASDPEIYAAATAAVLSEYSPEIIDYVTDPRTGLPSTSKWLPSVFEVREACQTQVEIAGNMAALHQMADQKRRILESPNCTPSQKSSAVDWLDHYEKRYGRKTA